MSSNIKTKRFTIGGMTCVSCQNKIERKLRNTAGIKTVKVNYSTGFADVVYDSDIITLKDISTVITKLGYELFTGNKMQKTAVSRVVGVLVIIVSLYVLLQQFGVLNMLVPSQLADTKMGYGMLFVIGLITSIHCIAMCGGINLSQCIPRSAVPAAEKIHLSVFRPAVMYNFGRVLSYTVIGFILGAVGLLLGSTGLGTGLPTIVQGILKLIAGAFMVIMGVNMLGIFPWLRKFQPGMPKGLVHIVNSGKAGSNSPFFVGLLNGLMPCGPLQSMQIVALASGNPLTGGLSMLLFSLGTVPLMLGFGTFVSALGKKFNKKVMGVGAVLIVVLGLAMLSQGASLSGLLSPNLMLFIILVLCITGVVSSVSYRKKAYKTVSTIAVLGTAILVLTFWSLWNTAYKNTGKTGSDSNITVVDGNQVIKSTLASGKYPNITVQAGVPVKWIINAPQGSINGCNYKIFIQAYGIEYSFKIGENVIEFTPDKAGTVGYSCWMGMIRGTITVTEAGAS